MNCTNIEFHTAALMAEQQQQQQQPSQQQQQQQLNQPQLSDGNNKATAKIKCNQHVLLFYFSVLLSQPRLVPFLLMCKALIGRNLTAKWKLWCGPVWVKSTASSKTETTTTTRQLDSNTSNNNDNNLSTSCGGFHFFFGCQRSLANSVRGRERERESVQGWQQGGG